MAIGCVLWRMIKRRRVQADLALHSPQKKSVTVTGWIRVNLKYCEMQSSILMAAYLIVIHIEYYDSVCFLSVVFTSRCVGKFDISRDRRSSEMLLRTRRN